MTKSSMGSKFLVLGFLIASGCAGVKIQSPANGSTSAQPIPITVAQNNGYGETVQGPLTLSVDGFDLSHVANTGFSVSSGSRFCCLDEGAHKLGASVVSSTNQVRFDTSLFTVKTAPGGYTGTFTCPAGGKVHPVWGTCCDAAGCDIPATSNFGAWRFGTSFCPGTSEANGCLNQNAQAVCGQLGNGCSGLTSRITQMAAVSFKVVTAGEVRRIQLPIGHVSGINEYRLLIAEDAAGKPGRIVDSVHQAIRAQPFPVTTPARFESSLHPRLAAGSTYWLVVGPGAFNTVGSWNYSPAEVPAANGSDFMADTTADSNGLPQIAGPWIPAAGSPLRPAFQVDLR